MSKHQRFCMYCQQFKPDKGFKFVVHPKTLTKRGQCPSCQERRKMPRDVLNEMAIQEAEERRKRISEAVLEAAERKRKNESTGDQ